MKYKQTHFILKILQSFVISLLLLSAPLPIFAGTFFDKSQVQVELVWSHGFDEGQRLEMEDMSIRGYEDAYKQIDLKQLKTPNLRTYAQRVFADVTEAAENEPSRFYISRAIRGGKIVGFSAFRETQNPGELYVILLMIDPEYQGKGITKHLLFDSKDEYSWVTSLILDARKLNTKAVTIYRYLGFSEDPSAILDEGIPKEEMIGFRYNFDTLPK